MILHIMPAEKFIDRAIGLFELAFPGKNQYWIFSYEEDGSDFSYVKTPRSEKVRFISLNEPWWNFKKIEFEGYQVLFLHNLYSPANVHFATKAPRHLQLHVSIWGYEFYGFKEFWDEPKYGEQTQTLLNRNVDRATGTLSSNYKRGVRALRLLTDARYKAIKPTLASREKAYAGIHTIHTHVKEDYRNILDRMYSDEGKRPKWSHFSYYSTEDYETNLSQCNTQSILIGNSATASNNHLEVFEMLQEMGSSHQIICPLNYGDDDYAQAINADGVRRFGDRFKPLLEFLPLESYNRLVSSCGNVVMNHYRQQAAGNIIASLLFGSKVFLSQRSPLFKHFAELGVRIFSVEGELREQELNTPLSEAKVTSNRQLISAYYSRENIVAELRKSIQFES